MISDTSDNSIQCHMKLFSVVLTVMQHAAAMEEAAGKSCCQLMLTIFTASLFIVSLRLCSDTNRLLQPHDVHYTSSESLQVAPPLGKKSRKTQMKMRVGAAAAQRSNEEATSINAQCFMVCSIISNRKVRVRSVFAECVKIQL